MRSKLSKPKKPQKPLRMYVVSKLIMASSIREALRMEKKVEPEDCRVAPPEAQPRMMEREPAVGFTTNTNDDYDE